MTAKPRAQRQAVRNRMMQSGERYTTARRNMLTGRQTQRCAPGICESTDRVVNEANSPDSAALLCHHCRLPVCVGCQLAPVENLFDFCDPCGQESDRIDRAEIRMLHDVWDDALDQGHCPVCSAGLPHIGSDCPEDPTRRIDTPPPLLIGQLPRLPKPAGRPWSPWEGFPRR